MSAQQDFAAALIDPGLPAPADLVAWNGSDPAQRFAVYRNNVAVSLANALATTFPVVRALVGDDFFQAMARLFAMRHLPRSVILARYGADFGDFIAGFAPAADLRYLPDVARLEAARVAAYHAADADSLDAAAFAALAPDDLAGLRIALHPSVAVLRARFAIVSLWAAHQGVLDIGTVDPGVPEDALILRPHDDVLVLNLPPGVAEALTALREGQPLGAAVARATGVAPVFDPAGLFRILIESGAAIALLPGAPHDP